MTTDPTRLEQELQVVHDEPAPGSSLGHPAVVLPAAWALALGVSSLLAIVLGVALAARLARRGRRAAAAISLALSPTILPPLAVASAVRDHAAGSAAVWRLTRPESSFDRLDPVLRCPRVRAAGGLYGAWGLPHDLALRALVALRGPIAGTYDGPLPDAHEAAALLKASEHRLPRAEVEAGQARLGGRTIQLPPKAVQELCLASLGPSIGVGPGDFKAALLEGRALLIGEVWDRVTPDAVEGPYMMLVDLTTGRVVAAGCERLPR